MAGSNRGGRRKGTPGKSYTNRTDLAADRTTQPVRTVPGQAYGEAGRQQAAQAAVPLPGPARMHGPMPGSLGPLDAPTSRPNEPVTAGVPIGAGPGPEALVTPGQDEDLAQLARYLPTLELLAGLPTATTATRNFVRRVRGAVPYRPNPQV